jgi:hypothetical protein
MATIKGEKMKKIFVILAVLLSLILSSCMNNASSQESSQVNQQQQQYIVSQPLPQFSWSLERHALIEIYKARNSAVSTYTIVYNPYLGIIQSECASYGYPIPGGTQLTNPEQIIFASNVVTLPQPEPNGTFSPPTSAGTYVLCRNEDGTASPIYFEDNVDTYPYPVTTNDKGQIVRADNGEPAFKINMSEPATTTP